MTAHVQSEIQLAGDVTWLDNFGKANENHGEVKGDAASVDVTSA